MRIKLILISLVVFSTALLAERTRLRPGRNAYTPQQDVELGREVAKEAEQQLVLVNNSSANQWYLGDFDYDGMCDGDDVTALGSTYNPKAGVIAPFTGQSLAAPRTLSAMAMDAFASDTSADSAASAGVLV